MITGKTGSNTKHPCAPGVSGMCPQPCGSNACHSEVLETERHPCVKGKGQEENLFLLLDYLDIY